MQKRSFQGLAGARFGCSFPGLGAEDVGWTQEPGIRSYGNHVYVASWAEAMVPATKVQLSQLGCLGLRKQAAGPTEIMFPWLPVQKVNGLLWWPGALFT